MSVLTGTLLLVSLAMCPETYAPYLLRCRATALSTRTGDIYRSSLDSAQSSRSLSSVLLRPLILLFCEPIVLVVSLYTAIIFGTLYMFLAAFPVVFQQNRGWSSGVGGLAFVGVSVGMIIAVACIIIDNRRYVTMKKAPSPEDRLPPALLGSCLIPVGLFWFAWTNGPEIHWSSSIIASSFFGMGLLLVFLSLINYLIDTYVIFAASVLAANSLLRSLFAMAFPLFASHMYAALGIHWASTVPAVLSLICLPIPFLLRRYGVLIRLRGNHSLKSTRNGRDAEEIHASQTP